MQIMSSRTTLIAALLLAGTGAALAQVPGDVTGGGAAPPAAAGAVPTLQQQSESQVAPGQSSSDPALAPGAALQGKAMPRADVNSGTTETFSTPAPQEKVEWPCAQRRVETISAGTIWSGPDLAQGKDWDQDSDVAHLARKLASRRLPISDADTLISDFAKQAGPEKTKKLVELFVGTLDIINDNRSEILQGIMRYAQGQERLAERMRTESDKIGEAQQDVQGPTGIAATEANRDFAWDQRIFRERKQALSFVCETPSLLERRAYEIGKRIQATL